MKLDKTQPVVLTVQPDFQDKPFVVVGAYDEVLPVQARYERTAPVSRLSSKVGQVAVMPVETAQPVLEGRQAAIVAKLYDKIYRRNVYGYLKQQRDDERDYKVMRWVGAITHDRCAKHERQLQAVRTVR